MFNTHWSLLSGCPYSRFNAPCDQLGLILFYTVLYLGLHTYLKSICLDWLRTCLALWIAFSIISLSGSNKNLNQLMNIWLNPWWVYSTIAMSNVHWTSLSPNLNLKVVFPFQSFLLITVEKYIYALYFIWIAYSDRG